MVVVMSVGEDSFLGKLSIPQAPDLAYSGRKTSSIDVNTYFFFLPQWFCPYKAIKLVHDHSLN